MIPATNNSPQRCPQYWQLYFARDAAAADYAQAAAKYADGKLLFYDVSRADWVLSESLKRQSQHLRSCPICLEWLNSLPDGEIFNDEP